MFLCRLTYCIHVLEIIMKKAELSEISSGIYYNCPESLVKKVFKPDLVAQLGSFTKHTAILNMDANYKVYGSYMPIP